MPCLGFDIGEKTCGVAKSDAMGWTAQPLDLFRFHQPSEIFSKINLTIKAHSIDKIVYGLPLNMNGTRGPQAEKVEQFIADLRIYLEKRGIHVDLVAWDERLSTMGAERALLEADISREKRKKVIDKMAACFILQGYLDSQR